MSFSIKIIAVLILDQLLGDPPWLPHPVRMIGWLSERCETFFDELLRSRKVAGCMTVATVVLTTILLTGVVFGSIRTVSPTLSSIIAILILYTSIAAKDLIVHSSRVYACLLAGDLDGAREAVAMIVGRDTADLDRSEICRACIETVAENMVDGVTAPLFYAICCALFASHSGFNDIELAAFGAMTYRAINTMDSMFGYKNEKYREFGFAAARLDDIANFIPARLSGLAVILAAFLVKLDGRGAARIFVRDRLQHSSPNSAHTESAVAGALGVRLGGDSFYFGEKIEKPVIGDSARDVDEKDILLTGKLVRVGALIFVLVLLILKGL